MIWQQRGVRYHADERIRKTPMAPAERREWISGAVVGVVCALMIVAGLVVTP